MKYDFSCILNERKDKINKRRPVLTIQQTTTKEWMYGDFWKTLSSPQIKHGAVNYWLQRFVKVRASVSKCAPDCILIKCFSQYTYYLLSCIAVCAFHLSDWLSLHAPHWALRIEVMTTVLVRAWREIKGKRSLETSKEQNLRVLDPDRKDHFP